MKRFLFFATISLLGGSLLCAGQEPVSGDHFSLSLPGENWAVEVHAQGFELKEQDLKSEKFRRFLATNPTSGLVLSIQLEKVPRQATLEECRQFQVERVKTLSSKFEIENVRSWDDGKMAFVEYMIPKYQDKLVQQKNLFACLPKDDVFADIHISKAAFEPKDEIALSAVMGTVYVADKPAGGKSEAGPSSMELFREGSALYDQGNLKQSIGPYQKALDLEKRERKLEANFWRVLVDNLGMAYGITGDLKNSKATFEYGLSQDKTYPMFYYNMACVYAEMNDMDNAMANLKTAFDYRQNVIEGESMPDPRTDDSFQRFMKNKDFRKFVDSLLTASK